jgi:hypothetical protein
MILQDTETVKRLENEIFSTPVPAKTESYSPVSHESVFNAILEEADKRGLQIKNKQYWVNKGGLQVTAKYNIVVPGDDEFGMMFAGRNSYDKSMSLGFAAGNNVWICTNGMVSGEITLVRRHTGSIARELEEKIQHTFNHLEENYIKLVNDANKMKEIEMPKSTMAELAGRLFIEEEIVNTTQLNILKNEIIASEAFPDENLWSMYNHVTESFKKSHAYTFIDNHIRLHNFVEKEFSLA